LEVNVSSKLKGGEQAPRGRTRETVAKEKNIPERKLRTSLEIDKKAGADKPRTIDHWINAPNEEDCRRSESRFFPCGDYSKP